MEIIGTIITILFGLFIIVYPAMGIFTISAFTGKFAWPMLIPIIIGFYLEYYIFTEIIHISVN